MSTPSPQEQRELQESEARALHLVSYDRRRVARLRAELQSAEAALAESEGLYEAARARVQEWEREFG